MNPINKTRHTIQAIRQDRELWTIDLSKVYSNIRSQMESDNWNQSWCKERLGYNDTRPLGRVPISTFNIPWRHFTHQGLLMHVLSEHILSRCFYWSGEMTKINTFPTSNSNARLIYQWLTYILFSFWHSEISFGINSDQGQNGVFQWSHSPNRPRYMYHGVYLNFEISVAWTCEAWPATILMIDWRASVHGFTVS